MREKLFKNYYKGPTLVVYNKAKAVYFFLKEMITEVLFLVLILPLYFILFVI